MQDWIVHFLNQYGYMGIIILIAVENLFPPIPSEIILTFGGFMTTFTNLKIELVVLSATLGSVIGAIILYGLGRQITSDRIMKLFSGKMGKHLFLKPSDLNRAKRIFNKSRLKTVFLCRFIPVIRSLISIPAGMAKMNFLLFLFYTTMGTLIWNTILVSFGAIAKSSWESVSVYMNDYAVLILGVLILIGLIKGKAIIQKK